jgi:hypothetical protein
MSKIHTFEPKISPLPKVMHADESACEEKQHHAIEEPSLSGLTNHPAECVGQRCRQQHDRQHFQGVGEGRGILVGMGAIGVEEARHHSCRGGS